MPDVISRKLNALDWIVAAVFACCGTYLWWGFFQIDPYSGRGVVLLAYAARIGLPLCGLGALYLYYRIRTGKLPISVALLILGGLLFAGLLVYPPVSYFYYSRSFGSDLDQYHPYLQLAPRDYQPRKNDSGIEPYRIFCLGGSTTEFTGDDRRGWPSRVEANLAGDGIDRTVEVYNLGRQWYTTQHTLYYYLTSLRQHRPQMILVMHAINDLLHNADFSYYSAGTFRDDYRHYHGPVNRLIRRPTLPQTVGRILRKIWYFPPRRVIITADFPGLAAFERNLRNLIDLARLDSVQVVLLTQPYLYKDSMTTAEIDALVMIEEAQGADREWDLQTAQRGMFLYNQTIRRLAGEEGLLLIDLEREMPKDLEYFFDEVHYRSKGFELIGQLVADSLRRVDFHKEISNSQ